MTKLFTAAAIAALFAGGAAIAQDADVATPPAADVVTDLTVDGAEDEVTRTITRTYVAEGETVVSADDMVAVDDVVEDGAVEADIVEEDDSMDDESSDEPMSE